MDFSNREMYDMVLMMGRCDNVAGEAAREYADRYPLRRHPSAKVFRRLEQSLCETGSFVPDRSNAGRPRSRRTVQFEERILDDVDRAPTKSTRGLAAEHETDKSTVHRVLQTNELKPFHSQKVQALHGPDRVARTAFCEWILEQHQADPMFIFNILFTDESNFDRDGVFNTHNIHHWAEENPYNVRESSHQVRWSINVWCGMLGDELVGPCVLPARLDGNSYREFLENQLPELLEDVPLDRRAALTFQHDGAPAHFSARTRQFLNERFPGRWIGRGGPIAWPPRSPDLNPLDYCLWGLIKEYVYKDPPNSLQALEAKIVEATATVTPEIVRGAMENLVRRCRLCIQEGGGHFENLRPL